MTGPEHYREAEKLLNFSEEKVRGSEVEMSLFAEAQVHATLALAAATAVALRGGTRLTREGIAWREAAGEPEVQS